MRRANDSAFLIIDSVLIGLNLGADFTSEHEWGIGKIKRSFGISCGATDWGIARRKIGSIPKVPEFGWTSGWKGEGEGIYLMRTWDDKIPNFSQYSELNPWGKSLACAWDEGSFGAFSTDAVEISYLRQIYDAFQNLDGAIFLGGGVFRNSGLCLTITSRIPQELLDGWYNADKEAYELDQEVEATGIRQLLKEKGKRYFALSRPRHRKADGKLILWLNPMDQHLNNFGWFTIEDLTEWSDGKGKIPIATGGKR